MDPPSFGAATTESPAPEQAETESYSPLPGFLKNVPDQDRAIVEKYVKDWDSGVTQMTQGIHEKYKNQLKPYQDLGEVEALQQLVQMAHVMNSDPVAAYLAMQEIIQNEHPESWEEIQGKNGHVEQEQESGQEFEDYGGEIPPQLQQLIEGLQNEIQGLKGNFEQQQQSAQEEQQMAQFDAMLDSLAQSHGDFDRDWVTLQIANGASPEDAVKKYNDFVNGIRNSQAPRPTPPPIIGGQGGVPNDQVDVSRLRGSSRRDLVEGLLKASQQPQG